MIQTRRLKLIPVSTESLKAELRGRKAFERHLNYTVPESWPPELFDEAAAMYTIARLRANPERGAWWLYYVILEEERPPKVVGTAGYKGPPNSQGTVELGYGVLPEFRRRGLATEATLGLVANAFRHDDVRRVVAETLPDLTSSIGVLEKCGFRFVGDGSERGFILYELTRSDFERRAVGMRREVRP